LAVAAVSRLAVDGVPPSVVEEIQQMTKASETFFPKYFLADDITADIGAGEMEPDFVKLMSGSTRLGDPTFEGDIGDLVKFSNLVAKGMAKDAPVITALAPDVDLLGIDKNAPILALPTPYERVNKLVPLKAPKKESNSLKERFWPQSRNPWVPRVFQMAGDPMKKNLRKLPNTGLEVLEMSGTTKDLSKEIEFLTGGEGISARSPLARVFAYRPDWPIAVAALQLKSPIAAKFFQDKPESMAVWRLAVWQALSRKKLKLHISGRI
jgi:hypothetical protein